MDAGLPELKTLKRHAHLPYPKSDAPMSCGLSMLLTALLSMARASLALSEDMAITPFGIFPRQCVRHVPSGARLRERRDGAVEVHVDGQATQIHQPKQICLEHANKTLTKQRPSSVPDGWLDYVEYYTPGDTLLGFFEGTTRPYPRAN